MTDPTPEATPAVETVDEPTEYVTERGTTIRLVDGNTEVVDARSGSGRVVDGDHYDNAVALATLFDL